MQCSQQHDFQDADTENLSSAKFCAFVEVLAACIDEETIKARACEKAKTSCLRVATAGATA